MDTGQVHELCEGNRRDSLMADIKSPEERSRNMAKIRSKDTKPELWFRRNCLREDTDIGKTWTMFLGT